MKFISLHNLRANPKLRLLFLAWVLMALAALRPSMPLSKSFSRHMFIFDITQSMNTEDVAVGKIHEARLTVAKRTTLRALRELPCGSEAGVAIFAGHRTFVLFGPIEICAHYREIAGVLSGLDWRMGWAAKSEIAKGLHSGLLVTKALARPTTLVFFTDGHEAPPINDSFRPVFEGTPAQVRGVVMGVGGMSLAPIPKFDTSGRRLGVWGPNDVMQVDPYSLGRATSEDQEQMVGVDRADVVQRMLQGQEHLSSLREGYLKGLAAALELRYQRLGQTSVLVTMLKDTELAERRISDVDVSWVPGMLALMILVYVQLVPRSQARR